MLSFWFSFSSQLYLSIVFRLNNWRHIWNIFNLLQWNNQHNYFIMKQKKWKPWLLKCMFCSWAVTLFYFKGLRSLTQIHKKYIPTSYHFWVQSLLTYSSFIKVIFGIFRYILLCYCCQKGYIVYNIIDTPRIKPAASNYNKCAYTINLNACCIYFWSCLHFLICLTK